MKASELIATLMEYREEHGDLDVRLFCDHNQTGEKATSVEVLSIPKDENENGATEELYSEEMSEELGWEEDELVQNFVIYGM